jgi:hypothetical protein
MRYFICNIIVISTGPLGIYAQLRVDKEQAEETSKQSSDLGFSASVVGPAQYECIVDNIEKYRVGILCHICHGYHV